MADFNSSSGVEIIDLIVTTTTSLLSSSSSSSAPTTSSLMTSDFYNFNSSGATWSPDYPEDINSDIVFYFSLYKVAVPLLFALIMLFGLVGNSLVIWVTITKRKMHTTVNQFLLNLAFSDISFLVVCVPFMAYHFAADDWLIGDIVCKVSQFILFVTVAVTVYTLVSIAVVRFLHIVYAHRMSRMKRWINPVIGVTWMVCSAVNVPVLLMYRVKELALLPETPYYYCGLQEPGTGKQLFLLFFIFTYVAPLSIIVTMYLLITRYLIKKRRRFGASTAAASPNPGGGAGRGSRASNAHVRRTSHASRIFIAIVVVFGLCWLPLHLHLQVVYFGSQPTGKSYQVFRMLCHVLAYSNSCVNPFIYHYVSSDFRQCLHSLIQPKWRRLLGRRGRSESTTTGCPPADRTALRELGTRPSIAGPTNPDIVIYCDDVSRPDREPQNRFEGNSWVSGAPSSQTQ